MKTTGLRACARSSDWFAKMRVILHLAEGFLTAMEGNHIDWTLAFRYLADAAAGLRKWRKDPRAISECAGL